MKVLHVVEKLGVRRFATFMVGTAFGVLALDIAIEHFAARPMKSPWQLTPVIFGSLAFLAVSAASLWDRIAKRWFTRVVKVVGVLSAAVGMLGTTFHARPIFAMLRDWPLSLDTLELALQVGPPLIAPGAFIGLGAVLWVLASRTLELRLRTGPSSASAWA